MPDPGVSEPRRQRIVAAVQPLGNRRYILLDLVNRRHLRHAGHIQRAITRRSRRSSNMMEMSLDLDRIALKIIPALGNNIDMVLQLLTMPLFHLQVHTQLLALAPYPVELFEGLAVNNGSLLRRRVQSSNLIRLAVGANRNSASGPICSSLKNIRHAGGVPHMLQSLVA